jgi:hypothetical protein
MPRPRKDSSEVLITLGVSVLPSVDEEIQAIADDKERTKSWVAGRLLLRGLAAFRKDGKLIVDESPKRSKRTMSGKSRKPSPAAIRKALDYALGFYGEPLSQKDREAIQQVLEQGAGARETE